MKNLFRTILRSLEEVGVIKTPEPRVTLKRYYIPSPAAQMRPGFGTLVVRDPRPYWEERGWRTDGKTYEGSYQTRFGNWAGYVSVSPAGRIEVFIHDPPTVLQKHPHWQCFNKREAGWYFVHPATRITDVSAAILGVEKTIGEAYEGKS